MWDPSSDPPHRGWSGPVRYGLTLALGAGLLSLLALLALALAAGGPDRWKAVPLAWIQGTPVFAAFGFLGAVSYRWYRSRGTRLSSTLVYVVTLLLATLGGLVAAWIVLQL